MAHRIDAMGFGRACQSFRRKRQSEHSTTRARLCRVQRAHRIAGDVRRGCAPQGRGGHRHVATAHTRSHGLAGGKDSSCTARVQHPRRVPRCSGEHGQVVEPPRDRGRRVVGTCELPPIRRGRGVVRRPARERRGQTFAQTRGQGCCDPQLRRLRAHRAGHERHGVPSRVRTGGLAGRHVCRQRRVFAVPRPCDRGRPSYARGCIRRERRRFVAGRASAARGWTRERRVRGLPTGRQVGGGAGKRRRARGAAAARSRQRQRSVEGVLDHGRGTTDSRLDRCRQRGRPHGGRGALWCRRCPR